MSALSEPFNYIDLAHQQMISLKVTSFLDGTATIHPRTISQRHVRQYMTENNLTAPPAAGTPITITTPVLRLFGTRLDEASPATYWDISSKTARADLLARLQYGAVMPVIIQMQANGAAPLKRYSISTAPA